MDNEPIDNHTLAEQECLTRECAKCPEFEVCGGRIEGVDDEAVG